ncbi:MAG: two-component regulator propeller domain-containing protein, partial [bacterium]
MLIRQKILFILIIHLCSVYSFAQDFPMRYKSITIKDGLSENHVNSIVQDKAGNMWFGTWFGLNKYDGLNLIPYYNVHIKERIHPLISCKELLVDKTGNIWCVFEGKVLIINNHLNTKQIAEFFPSAQNIHITESNSDAMYFWYSGNNKLIAYNRSSRDTTVHIMPFRIKDVLYHENKFYFATNKGMFTQKEKELGNPKKIKKLLPEAEKLNLQNEKTLWISTSTGVVLFNPEKQERIDRKFGKTNHLKLKDMFNGPVCFDNQNRIWGKTLQNRLVNFHTTNQTWDTIDFINKDVYQNYSTKINDLLVDDFSILWIATSEGVKYLDLNQNPINNFIDFNKEMAGGNCKAIEIENEKKLWVLHENGLSTYSADNSNINNLIFRTDHLLPNEWNAPMVKYRKGIYLIGAYGLDIYDSNSGSFYYINPDSTAQGLPDWMIYDIHKGQKSGEIWIGSNGFSRLASLELPLQNKKQEGIHKGNATFETLIKDIRVYTIYEDAEGYLWLATVVGKEGLKRYNPKTKELVNVGDKYFNNNYTVSCIYEYPKGVLWLGTEGGGLFKLTGDLTGRPRDIHIEQIEKEDGLCSNFIQSLIADNSGKLWIATINGLSCIEPSTNQITIFNKHSSFVSVRFNRNAVCKKDGEIFLGSSNGIVSFIPEK